MNLLVSRPDSQALRLLTGLTSSQLRQGKFVLYQNRYEKPEKEAALCKKSYWIYTDTGGLLTVPVDLTDQVKKGDLIANLRDVFGNLTREYYAPEDGIVIGKSVSPVNQSGGRILHLGILK